jgi:hypothetical protein
MDTHKCDLLMVRDGQARCRYVARPCQGDTMKKGISLDLDIMPMVSLVVAVVVASIILNTKKI